MTFSLSAGIAGLVGLAWFEAIRILARVQKAEDKILGMSWTVYSGLVVVFGVVAVTVAGYSASNFVGGVIIGFGIEAGPVASGMSIGAPPPAPGGTVEEMGSPVERRAPSISRFFTRF